MQYRIWLAVLHVSVCNVQSAIVSQSNTPSAKCHITEARSKLDADDEGAEEDQVDEDRDMGK